MNSTVSRLTMYALMVLIIGSCKKRNELRLDLAIVDQDSGQPVKSNVRIEYTNNVVGQGSTVSDLNIGETDDEGRLKYRCDVRNKYHLKLIVSGGRNYSHSMFPDYSWGKEVSKGSKNKMTIALRRNYHYLLSVKSVDCFDQTDTAWISVSGSGTPGYRKIGCVDETILLGGYSDLTYTSTIAAPVFHVKVKRNGIVTEFDQPVTLQFGSITPVQIDY